MQILLKQQNKLKNIHDVHTIRRNQRQSKRRAREVFRYSTSTFSCQSKNLHKLGLNSPLSLPKAQSFLQMSPIKKIGNFKVFQGWQRFFIFERPPSLPVITRRKQHNFLVFIFFMLLFDRDAFIISECLICFEN